MNLGIYLVTDRTLCGERGVVETVRAAVDGGVATVQLRDKHADLREQLRRVERLAEAIAGRALLLVNDRLDVVRAARERGIPVDGVHLGQSDPAALAAREELGPDAVIGLTANTDRHFEAIEAMPEGTVDYVGIGVIRPTSTKPDHPPALGLDGFEHLAALAPVPAVAIGGIALHDVARLRRGGAAGVAIVSAICATANPEETARNFVRAWDSA